MANIDKKITVPELPSSQGRPENFQLEMIKWCRDLGEGLLKYSTKLGDIINGGLRLSENLDVQIKTITIAAANTEEAVAHTLKRIPAGYLVISINKAAIIYDGTTAWTSANLYIKTNTADTTVKVLIF